MTADAGSCVGAKGAVREHECCQAVEAGRAAEAVSATEALRVSEWIGAAAGPPGVEGAIAQEGLHAVALALVWWSDAPLDGCSVLAEQTL